MLQIVRSLRGLPSRAAAGSDPAAFVWCSALSHNRAKARAQHARSHTSLGVASFSSAPKRGTSNRERCAGVRGTGYRPADSPLGPRSTRDLDPHKFQRRHFYGVRASRQSRASPWRSHYPATR